MKYWINSSTQCWCIEDALVQEGTGSCDEDNKLTGVKKFAQRKFIFFTWASNVQSVHNSMSHGQLIPSVASELNSLAKWASNGTNGLSLYYFIMCMKWNNAVRWENSLI